MSDALVQCDPTTSMIKYTPPRGIPAEFTRCTRHCEDVSMRAGRAFDRTLTARGIVENDRCLKYGVFSLDNIT